MRDIAKRIDENPKYDGRTLIYAEALIRNAKLCEAYTILRLICELLVERVTLLSSDTTCPDDLKCSVATIIWAAYRMDIKELNIVRKRLKTKYGKVFDNICKHNEGDFVDESIILRLSLNPQSPGVLTSYLNNIAERSGHSLITPRTDLESPDSLPGTVAVAQPKAFFQLTPVKVQNIAS